MRAFFLKLVRRVKKNILKWHPYHWFDEFMDGIEIELKEFG